MRARRTAALLAMATSTVLASALLASPAAPAAITPSVTLDLATLSQGPPPSMPYIDVATEQIRDGARVVDLTGLQRYTRSRWLWKVDGGYVLDRFLNNGRKPPQNQLLFVSRTGRGKVLSNNLTGIDTPLVVSSQYGRVAYMEVVDGQSYLAANDVPSGRLVGRRTMPSLARPVTYRGRVLTTHLTRAFYWTPGVTAVQRDRRLDRMVSTDIRAGQSALRESPVRVAPFPPGTDAGWTDPELDLWRPSPAVVWSPNGALLAGSSLAYTGDRTDQVVHLRRSADGVPVLDIHVSDASVNGQLDQLYWETDDTVIMRFSTFLSPIATVRCTTAGVCNRIGPFHQDFTTVPVIRNVS
jgi:hypothetical protein